MARAFPVPARLLIPILVLLALPEALMLWNLFPHHPAPAGPVRRYPIRGVALRLEPAEHLVLLRHDEVPGFMPAMTMPLELPDAAVLAQLKPGDSLAAVLEISSLANRLTEVRVVGHNAEALAPVGYSEPGPLPDVVLTDSSGRTFHALEFRGRAVALSFLYTRCPLPDACPRLARDLAECQRLLEARPGLPERVRILTVTLEPSFDTPARLARYARTHGAHAPLWTLARADSASLEALRRAAQYLVEGAGVGMTHSQSVVVYGPDGRPFRRLGGTDWTPDSLMALLAEAAGSPAPKSRDAIATP